MAVEYQLYCTACSFEETVEGLEQAFETQADHEQQHGPQHFVAFEQIDESINLP